MKHIVEAIRHHAFDSPYRCALSDSRHEFSCADLDAFSTRCAVYLKDRGCRPADRVVMLASRRALTVATIFGVFKAGGIHVPLDAGTPQERRRYILDDIEPAIVIAADELVASIRPQLPPSTPIVPLGELERLVDDEEGRAECDALVRALPLPPLDERAIAYCLYTSGSTGRPKGVLIGHDSIVDFLDGAREVYDVTRASRCVSFSPLHFDVFLMDMLFPLAQGAHLRLHDDVVAPGLLFDTLQRHEATHFSAWGLMLGLVAQADAFESTPLPHLQTILTGTDVPDVKVVQRWLAKRRGVKVVNAYGPTEATCAATAHVIRDLEPHRQALYPIGVPLKRVQVRLVDDGGRRIEHADTPGELWVGGGQVMRRYWKLPAETSARLVHVDGVPFYRTGDLCRYLPDGSLFYIGRMDDELKLGGYRIHLSEIQRAINGVACVLASEIVLAESPDGEKVLAAGVLLDRGRRGDAGADARTLDAIRQRLRNEVAGYMVPRHIDVLDRFPQLSSGKTDRQALLTLLQQRIHQRHEEEVHS